MTNMVRNINKLFIGYNNQTSYYFVDLITLLSYQKRRKCKNSLNYNTIIKKKSKHNLTMLKFFLQNALFINNKTLLLLLK